MDKRMELLQKKIGRVRAELQLVGDMRPGTLSRQEKNGKDYYQVSYTYKMRSKTEYVRTASVARLKKEIIAYKKFKKLTRQWIDAALDLSKLKSKLEI